MTNGDTSSHNEYMPLEAVADRLRLSVRQTTRYAERVRTLKKGRRIYYHRDDVEALADELNVEGCAPTPPRTERMPASAVMQICGGNREATRRAHVPSPRSESPAPLPAAVPSNVGAQPAPGCERQGRCDTPTPAARRRSCHRR